MGKIAAERKRKRKEEGRKEENQGTISAADIFGI